MRIFDVFKKKEEEPGYDITNLSVRDLDEGFILDYDMKSWQVKEVYEYDWGSNNFSREYMLDSGDEVIYLSVEDKGEMLLTVCKNIKIRKLGEDFVEYTVKNEQPPKKLIYEGVEYFLDSDNAGYFNDVSAGNEDWEELIAYEYFDEEEELIISVTQWDDRNFESSAGRVIKEYELSNFIPAGREPL